MARDVRQRILDTVGDLVNDLLYYDRKEDEDLPFGTIQEAITCGKITEDEIVAEFATELRERLLG